MVECAPPPAAAAGGPGTPDRADRLAARLGTENMHLVHDARRHLDPGLLAAEAGTVPAGGLLTLLVPPLDDRGAEPRHSRSGARFARLLLEHLAAEPATSARTARAADEVAALAFLASPTADSPDATVIGVAAAPAPTAPILTAQDTLMRRALAHLTRGDRPLVVIEAPRGHGKSALLGRIAARLADAGTPPVLCAARRSAVDVLERHRELASNGAPLVFLAPDAALVRGGDTLLVDEAASLPLPLLVRLLTRWRRLVLATTSAGYEGAGRAFALRLPGVLDRERPGWLRLTPAEPMRWRAGDPLDALLARAILSNAPLARRPARTLAALPELPATRVDRDDLVRDDRRLTNLFGLLVATHYQSTPLDLGHLLDGEDMALWSIEHDDDVLGAALVAIEPGVPPELHDDVLARRRRLPHRLLPQLLAQSANDGTALDATFARVVRIAVHPDARRHGLGHRLLASVESDTRGRVEAIGASFGGTPATTAFWTAAGFVTFHRGHRPNPRSGRRALAVLRANSVRTRRVLGVAAAIHRDNASAEPTCPPSPDAPADEPLLERFAHGERNLSDTRAALWRLARSAGAASGRGGEDDATDVLSALGLDVPTTPRAREGRLREWVRHRLERAQETDSPD